MKMEVWLYQTLRWFIILQTLISVPIRIFFLGDEINLWHFVDYAFNSFIWIQGFLAYNYEMHYWIYILFAGVPYDLILILLNVQGSCYARISTLVVLLQLPQVYNDISRVTWKWSVPFRRMLVLFGMMTICSHWIACIWHGLDKANGLDYSWRDNDPYGKLYSESLVLLYIRAMYFSCITISTVGFGEIVPVNTSETIFVIVVIYVGVTFSCASIANFISMMREKDAEDIQFQKEMDDVSACLTRSGANEQVRRKVLAYVKYAEELSKADENENIRILLKQLPEALREKIAREHQTELFREVPLFHRASQALQSAIAHYIQRKAYSPGDTIVRENHAFDRMFFLCHGVAQSSKRGRNIRQMKSKEFVGDASLLYDLRQINDQSGYPYTSEFSIHAITFCEVLVLTNKHFHECLEAYNGHHEVNKFLRQSRSQVQMRRSSSNLGIENSTQDMDAYRFHPESNFRQCWSMLCFAGLLFNLVFVPKDIVCAVQFSRYDTFSWEVILEVMFAILIDVIFIVDVYFKLYYFSFENEGIIVTDKNQIRTRYTYSFSFCLDAVAALPLEVLVPIVGTSYIPALRINKIARLFHLYEYFQVAEALLIARWNMDVFFRRLLKSLLLLMLSGYVVGAMWTFIGFATWNQNNWILQDFKKEVNFLASASALERNDISLCSTALLRGTYFAFVGSSTLGFGDIVPVNVYETIFASIFMLYGAIMKPAVVGSVASLILLRSKNWTKHRRRLYYFHRLAEVKGICHNLQERVNCYFDYIWTTNRLLEKENKLLSKLPADLRAELAISMWQDILTRIPVFRAANDELLTMLYASLTPKLYLPSDSVVKMNAQVSSFCVLLKGSVEVFTSHRSETQIVSGEDPLLNRCFGYEAFASEISSQKVVALTYCECILLNRNTILTIYAESPDFEASVLNRVQKKGRSQRISRLDSTASLQPSTDCNEKIIGGDAIVTPSSDECTFGDLDCNFRYWWGILVCIAIVYNIVAIPFRIAYFDSTFDSSGLKYFVPDWAFDIVLFMDAYFRWNCFHLIKDGKSVHDRKGIQSIYMDKWNMFADFVCNIPIDIAVILACCCNSSSLIYLLSLGRSPKLLHARHLQKMLSFLEGRGDGRKGSCYSRWAIFQMFLLLSVTAHSVSCLWFFIARIQNHSKLWAIDCASTIPINNSGQLTRQALCEFQQTWIVSQVNGNYLPKNVGTTAERYLRSMYFGLQIILIVTEGVIVPATVPETWFLLCLVFTGVIVSASFIGFLSAHILQLDSRSAKLRRRCDATRRWMQLNLVPKRLQLRSLKFMRSMWDRKDMFVNEDEVISNLPRMFRSEIRRYSKMEKLNEWSLLSTFSTSEKHVIADIMKRRVYSPGDEILVRGQTTRLVIFFNATPENFVDCGDNIARAPTGLHVFGVAPTFSDVPQEYSVSAVDYTEVYLLKGKDLDKLFEEHEELGVKLTTNFRKNMAHQNVSLCSGESRVIEIGVVESPTLVQMRSMGWNLLLLISMLYCIIIIPLRISYLVEDRHSNIELFGWFAIDILVSVMYNIDSILHATQSTTKFERFLEVLSNIPWAIMALVLQRNELVKFMVTPLLFRCFAFFRCLRAALIAIQVRFSLVSSFGNVLHCIACFLFGSHWFACAWMFVHRYMERSRAKTWVTEDPYLGGDALVDYDVATGMHNICHNMFNCYVRAYYFDISFISTVGFGEIRPQHPVEDILRLIETVAGAMLLASLIGSFGGYFRYTDTYGINANKTKLWELAQYFRSTTLTFETKIAVERNAKLLWKSTHGLTEDLIKRLPMSLRIEIAEHRKHTILTASPFLFSQTPALRSRIALALRFQVCCANQVVISAGDLANEILFINNGRVKIDLGNGMRPIYGGLGDHFGRATKGGCDHTVLAIEDSELYILDEEGMREVMDHIPQSVRIAFLRNLDTTSLHAVSQTRNLRIPSAFIQTPRRTQSHSEYTSLPIDYEEVSDFDSIQSLTPMATQNLWNSKWTQFFR